MANIEASNVRIIQSYGGYKEVYFEADSASSSDTISFPETLSISNIKMVVLQDKADGSNKNYTITGADENVITVGSGVSGKNLVGRAIFRSY